MPRDYKVYLEDILGAIDKIKHFTTGFSRQSFSADLKTVDAVLRNLEVIGEAAKKVPDDIRSGYQNVDWRKIAGLRDILIHEYFGIDVDIVWDIVENKMPILEKEIRHILQD